MDGLEDVLRVVRRLDPRWFSVPDVAVEDRALRFAYGLRVWGVTAVTACIVLRGGGEPLFRSGRMSLAGTAAWGPEPADPGRGCTGIAAG